MPGPNHNQMPKNSSRRRPDVVALKSCLLMLCFRPHIGTSLNAEGGLPPCYGNVCSGRVLHCPRCSGRVHTRTHCRSAGGMLPSPVLRQCTHTLQQHQGKHQSTHMLPQCLRRRGEQHPLPCTTAVNTSCRVLPPTARTQLQGHKCAQNANVHKNTKSVHEYKSIPARYASCDGQV
jgi:hypothetical protein